MAGSDDGREKEFVLRKTNRGLRLDLFLKSTRLCPRRSLAQKLCDAGRVAINGTPAKSAHSVKPGDEIEIRRRDQILRILVRALPETRQLAREDARSLYEHLGSDSIAERFFV